MKKFLAALLALSLTFGSVALPAAESGVIARGVNISASAETYSYGDFEYEVYDDDYGDIVVAITKYTGKGEKVVIPSTINGKKVTSIGDSAFRCCESLTSVTIPNSVKFIDIYAFFNCTNLTSINIPNSVTYIGAGAFETCKNLTSITIPDSVTSIGDYAFSSCTSLTSITIPDSVTSIGDSAFYACTSLTSITIPDSVTSIGDSAFLRCESLTNITIPNSVTSIGDCVFNWCTSLKNITVDSNNKNYTSKDGVLFNKKKTTLICCPIGNERTTYTIPNSVTSIGYYALSGCTSLTSITIPDGVTSIGDHAFTNCTSLTSITIPDSVTSIGEKAFSGCTSLTSVTIPNSVTSIGYFAFHGCTSLTSITIPNSVTWISDSAFEFCTSLTNITIPNSVTSIGDNAFSWCQKLTSITIPDSVTSIGNDAFSLCWQLKDVYYTGSANDWTKIEIAEGNEDLTNATIHYNYDPNHKHSYTSSITKQPTCTAEGIRTFKCNCGDTYTETIPAKGHTVVTDKAVAATCTTDGKTAGSHCSVCGKVIKAQTVIKAKGHKSSNWIVDKPAAIGVKGSKHKECTVCHKVLETAEIPALSATDISGASVTLSTNSYTYNGKAKKPTATVTLNGKTLKKDVDYTVKYLSNTAIGKAKVTITGKGNYKGTVSKTFKILPAKQTIAKLTAQKKGFALTWTEDKNVTGYQIQYDVKSDFKSAKSDYVKSNSTYKKTISGLKAKKTYYVRVRSYKTVGGVKYYGSWSANKKIKTK